MKDSLLYQQLNEGVNIIDNGVNYWLWIVIIQFIIIMYLLFFKKKNRSKIDRIKEEALNGDIDFNNIINSSFNAKALYDELKIKCHPDRFPKDKELNEIANNLFQEISKNKNNLNKLSELKITAEQKLNINFKH